MVGILTPYSCQHHLLSIQLVTRHCLVVVVAGICSVGLGCPMMVVEGGHCFRTVAPVSHCSGEKRRGKEMYITHLD